MVVTSVRPVASIAGRSSDGVPASAAMVGILAAERRFDNR
jgi:hypothetical protein